MQTITGSRIGAAILMASPWLALTVFSLEQAQRHWRAMFPFGAAGLCGDLHAPHCGWCASAAVALLAGAAVFVVGCARETAISGFPAQRR
ncbi:MAG TPA: hypothetical protein VFN88_01075 [Caulobacteraceae bacterium]|nr:hypothetical protein [Caulobacteraceae bacterium]